MDELAFTVAAPDLISTGAESIVERGRSLGLTWAMRPGTVQKASTDLNGYVGVKFDGDTKSINAVNLTGDMLQVDQRIMGILIPPAGTFIVGILIQSPTPRGTLAWDAADANSAAAGAIETVVLTTPPMQLTPGRAYRLHHRGVLFASTTNQTIARVRVNSVSGQLLDETYWQVPGTALFSYETSAIVVYPIESPPTTVVFVLTLTANAGTTTHAAGTTSLRYLEISDAGPGTSFPERMEIL